MFFGTQFPVREPAKKAQFAHNHIHWIISLFWSATCWLTELLHRGKVESVFAEELCFPGRSPSDSLLFSSLCPAGLIDETTLCSSDHHSHSLKKNKKTEQHPLLSCRCRTMAWYKCTGNEWEFVGTCKWVSGYCTPFRLIVRKEAPTLLLQVFLQLSGKTLFHPLNILVNMNTASLGKKLHLSINLQHMCHPTEISVYW